MKLSVKSSSFVKYYSSNDIPQVVTALCSSVHHAVSYAAICQAVLKYWELPQFSLPPHIFQTMDLGKKDDGRALSCAEYENQFLNKVEHEDYVRGVGESILNHASGGVEKCFVTPGSDGALLGAPMQNDLSSPIINEITMNEVSTTILCKMSEHAALSCSPPRGLADGSSTTGGFSCNDLAQNNAAFLSGIEAWFRTVPQQNDTCLYMGSVFKSHAYINHYVHGEFAASAAANFSMLSSDEKRLSEVHASDPRKVMAANVALQIKAFSSAASRFFWPSTEKKLVEIPRERCSWCLHCKAPVTSKKACLLNQAALNATRAAMKFCSGLKFVKNAEGGLYGIAAYVLYMEECLRGLVVGPFQSASYQKQWRKKVEHASTCSEMKSLLLEVSLLSVSVLWSITLQFLVKFQGLYNYYLMESCRNYLSVYTFLLFTNSLLTV